MTRQLLLMIIGAAAIAGAWLPAVAGADAWPKAIFPGEYPDPSIIRDGRDFYLTYSSLYSRPGLIIWHSRDLINWNPVASAAKNMPGAIWAPEIAKIGDGYSIYFPQNDNIRNGKGWSIYRVTAPSMTGPWSEPAVVAKNVGIDPGIAVDDDGTPILWLHHGKAARISLDGATTVEPVKGGHYQGWKYPACWRPGTKNTSMESPKLFKRGGWWYLVSAQGGTGGPWSAHHACVARSKTPLGPWENSPYNPLIHTWSEKEEWHCTGHATLFDDAQGGWWAVYHGYRNGFRTLGRSILLAPIAWTDDGWPVLDRSGRESLPQDGTAFVGGNYDDDFKGDTLSLHWLTFDERSCGKASVGGGALRISATGGDAFSGTVLLFKPSVKSYAAAVVAEPGVGTQAGLVLFYDRKNLVGATTDGRDFFVCYPDGFVRREPNTLGKSVCFRIVNDSNSLSLYASGKNGKIIKLMDNVDVSAMYPGGGRCKDFLSLQIGLVTAGEGSAVFRSFRYRVQNADNCKVK